MVAYIAVSNAHLTGDEYAWLLLAREWIHHDAELYVSIVDNKGPILILLYGIITLFDGHEVLITTLLGGGCISVAAWCITKLRRSTSAADLLSIFIILGSPTLYGGTLPNSELLSGVLILLATITYYKRERTLWLSLWLLLLATFTNPKSLYFMVPLAALLLLDLRKTGIHLIADRFSFPAFLVIFGCTLVLFPVFANYVEFMISLPKGDYYSRLPVLNSGCHESFFSCINTERKDLLKLFFKNPVIIFCLLSLLYALYKRPSTTFYALLTFCIGYILFLVYVGRASGQYLIWLVLLGVIVIRQRYLLWVSAVLVLLQFAPYNGANNSSLLPEGLDSDARWFYFGRGESARFHYVEDLRPCVADYANWFVYPLFFLDTEKNINLENNTYLDHYKEQINQCDPDMIVVSDAYYHTAEPIWLSDLLSTYQLKQQYSEQRIYERKNEP